MAHQFNRDITPLTNTFTEETDISLDSSRHMMLHELQILMQEIKNIKLDVHNNEKKSKRLKIENDTHMQKLLGDMKEMKLYINELETEKQKTNAENNELRTQVMALREKQEKEINELRSITNSKLRMIKEKYQTLKVEIVTHLQKLLEPIKEMKLYISKLEKEKQRTNTENNELRTQVTALREKQEKEINELRYITNSNLRITEEKYKTLKVKNDTHLQKLMMEMKLYRKEQETEKERINRQNNELRTNLRMIEEKYKMLKVKNDTHLQKLLVEMNEMKLFMNELNTEKKRISAEQNEMRTQVTNLSEKQDKTINELRTTVSGQETKISVLETKYCHLNTECRILKVNVSKSVTINGLYEQMMEDIKSEYWGKSFQLMKRHLNQRTEAYKQLDNIIWSYNFPSEAAQKGYIELIKVMLDNGLPINNVYYSNNTMLHKAAEYGQYTVVKFLIEQGADINAIDRWRETPLHKAAYTGHKSVVQYLVDVGCNTTVINIDFKTAANVAKTPEIRAIIEGKMT